MKLLLAAFVFLIISGVLCQFFDEDLRREGYEIPESKGRHKNHLRLTKRKVCKYNPDSKATSMTTSSEPESTKTSQETPKATKTTTERSSTTKSKHTTKTKYTSKAKSTSNTHKPSKTNQSTQPSKTPSSECPVPGGKCQGNELRCSGYSYAQCNLGRWTLRACSKDKSMVCVEAGASLFCGTTRNYVLKGCSGVPK